MFLERSRTQQSAAIGFADVGLLQPKIWYLTSYIYEMANVLVTFDTKQAMKQQQYTKLHIKTKENYRTNRALYSLLCFAVYTECTDTALLQTGNS